MSSEVMPLFPTFVWKIQLAREVEQPVNDRISRALKAMAPELERGQALQSFVRQSQNLWRLTQIRPSLQ